MSARTSAWPWLGIRLLMADELEPIVEVNGPEIVVRTPGGSFSVTYE